MKKQRLKNYLKFGIFLFGITIAINSCQQDDFKIDEFAVENETPFSMKIISNNEIKENSIVFEQLKKFSKNTINNNVLAREVDNSNYGFTVNTDYSKFVESNDGSLHSYTFLIEREEEGNEILENLVLTLQTDGTYKTEVVSYDFINDDQAVIKTTPLENFDTSQYLSRMDFSYSCTTTVSYTLSFSADCSCQYLEVISVDTNCTVHFYGGGGGTSGGGNSSGSGWSGTIWTGGGGGGSSSGTGTGNTNGNTGTTIATSPFTQSHIDRLTTQTKNIQVKARIQQMEGDLDTATKEQGSEFRRNSNVPLGGDLYSEYQIPASQTTFSGTRFPNALSNSQVRVHMHHTIALIQMVQN